MAVWLELFVAIIIPFGGSFVISLLTDKPGDWYKSLNKPTWTPPSWAFPMIWSILYVLMGVASWLVWKQGGFEAQALPLGLYALQLLLNFCWTPLFFGLKRVDWALCEIVLMWVAILATIVAFFHVDRLASALLLPYIAWVSLAAGLNYYIHVHNHNTLQGLASDLAQPLHST